MEASSMSPPIPPPPPSSMYSVKRSFSTPCDPRDEDDGCNLHLSQRLAKTPPLTPKKGGKMLALKIQLLDDTVTIIQAQTKALGRVVFDQVCKQLNVLEADYFGLEYQDSYGTKYWLDLEKRLSRQVGLSLGDPTLRFSVKFYTPDPSQLEEEFTRYLFSLQIKRDLATGTLQCNDNTAALMASFIVQAECGDFNEEDYPDASYLSTFKFVPHQDLEMEKRIRENHRKHVGQSPAEADLHLLETARRTELYGIKMHPAKDEEGVPLNLSVCHLGLVLFQNFTKINTFSWAKIRKLSFKRKRFILKLHPEGYGYYKETVEFIFDTRNECKSFWKRCVEHHAFFRCEKAPNLSGSSSGRSKGLLTSRGSSFRYSGRTQKQMVAFVRENFVKRGAPQVGGSSTFQRSASFRSTHNVMSSASVSAGGGHHSGVSTSCSSPAMMSAASAVLPMDDQVMDKMYPNMDYPDSPVEIRSQDSQQDTLSPGTSVTSSPQRYVPAAMLPPQQGEPLVGPPPPPPVAVYHPQYPPQGQSSQSSRVSDQTRVASTTRSADESAPEFFEDQLSDESLESDLTSRFGSFGQHEFPVTTVKNIERKLKVFESQGIISTSPLASLASTNNQQSKETIRRTRKQRSKSLTVRSEIVSEDDDEVNFFTIPRRKEKLPRKKVTDEEFHRPGDETTSQGSYDLLVSNERVDEVPLSAGGRRRLIHQKESFFEDFPDSPGPIKSPPIIPIIAAPPFTTSPINIASIIPPTLSTNIPIISAPSPAISPSTASTPAVVIVKKQPEKRVLTLKSEEQLVEEAGIWLEAGAISTSGSFKRKMKKKQEALERLENEIISYSNLSTGNSRGRESNRSLKHYKKESLSPRESLDKTKSFDKPNVPRAHAKYTRSQSNPIEVDVSIIQPPPEFPSAEIRPTPKARGIDPRKIIPPEKTTRRAPPPEPLVLGLVKSDNIPDLVPVAMQPKPRNINEEPPPVRKPIPKPKPKGIVDENRKLDEIPKKIPLDENLNTFQNHGTRNGNDIDFSHHYSAASMESPVKVMGKGGPTNSAYQVAPNEVMPLSKSFELEPLIEDFEPPPTSSVVEETLLETEPSVEKVSEKSSIEKSLEKIDKYSGPPPLSKKTLVRKTKSEGAFDTGNKVPVLKRSSTEKKPGKTTSAPSKQPSSSSNQPEEASTEATTPAKNSIHFEEVDVPYLLRRRIDLDCVSSSPGSTLNFHHHHESLSKSKSYGGTCTEPSSSTQQLKRLVYCSMTDLPPVTNYSWRDDTLDGPPPIWDEADPFSLAIRRTRGRSNTYSHSSGMRKIRSEELETVAADLIDDIMRSVNAECVKELSQVVSSLDSLASAPAPDIETIKEEKEEEKEEEDEEVEIEIPPPDVMSIKRLADDAETMSDILEEDEVGSVEDDDQMKQDDSLDEISSEGEKVYEAEDEIIEEEPQPHQLSSVEEEDLEEVENNLNEIQERALKASTSEDPEVPPTVPLHSVLSEEEPEKQIIGETSTIPSEEGPEKQIIDETSAIPSEEEPEKHIIDETSDTNAPDLPEDLPEEEEALLTEATDNVSDLPLELPPVPDKDEEDEKTMTPEDLIAAEEPPLPLTPTAPIEPKPSPKSNKPPLPEKPLDILYRKLRKDSTASLDDFPLPPLPDGDGEYNCETPRYPPPPDILQFSYPSRRGSYNRRRSSVEMEAGSFTDSLTTVIENASNEIINRRLHLSRSFSVSQEESAEEEEGKPKLPPRRTSITEEANIPPSIQEEEDPFTPTPTNEAPETVLPGEVPPPLPPHHGAPAPPPPVPLQAAASLGTSVDSLSKQSSTDSLPEPPDPLYDMVESRNSDTISEHSESPEAPLFLNMAAGTIGFPRTLSRISERTHSSEETDSNTSQFIEKIEIGLRRKLEEASSLSPIDDLDFPCMRKFNANHETSEDLSGSINAPIATLTSELADSSATLNDMDEIINEEVEDFVDDEVGNVNLPVELRPEIVHTKESEEEDEDEDTFGARNNPSAKDDTTTTSQRHRVEVSLKVRDGRIVFEEQ